MTILFCSFPNGYKAWHGMPTRPMIKGHNKKKKRLIFICDKENIKTSPHLTNCGARLSHGMVQKLSRVFSMASSVQHA